MAAESDLTNFFDTVENYFQICRIRQKMCNKHVSKLIGKYRWARVMTNGCQERQKGASQNNTLSPLPSNLL